MRLVLSLTLFTAVYALALAGCESPQRSDRLKKECVKVDTVGMLCMVCEGNAEYAIACVPSASPTRGASLYVDPSSYDGFAVKSNPWGQEYIVNGACVFRKMNNGEIKSCGEA